MSGSFSTSFGNLMALHLPVVHNPQPATPNLQLTSSLLLDLARLDAPAPLPYASHPYLPFVPLYENAILVVGGDQLLDATGAPLFATWTPVVPNRRYLNRADRRFLLFDFLNVGAAGGCGWHQEVLAAFGSVAADEMCGEVMVRSLSSCPGPAVIHADPNGHFRMRLVRVVPR